MNLLTEKDFEDAANAIGCEVATIKAVCEVESPKGGFNEDGTLTTLFEAHHFHKYTKGAYDKSHPNLSSPTWNRALYGRNWKAERLRLAEAAKLDPIAAILSTSWGRFQTMGFNFALCGFKEASDMPDTYALGEREQLMGFVEYVQRRNLDDELRNRLWLPFAIGYNGRRAEENQYPQKLAAAYRKYDGHYKT